jgi:virginiamycin B lyase
MRRSGRLAGLPLLVLLAGLLTAGPASAAPAVNGVFDLSGEPVYMTAGPDGNIWVVLNNSGNDLARITPAGTVTEFNPVDVNQAKGITAGPDGNLWVTQPNEVARIPPADPNAAQKFAVAAISDPRAITTGPDGNLWAGSGDKLVKIPPANPAGFEEFTIAGMSARGIDSGGGRLWIADFGDGRIISATTAGVPTPVNVGGNPQEVAAGPGDQVGYGNPGTDPQTVGRISFGGAPQTTNTPLADPFGVAFGPDGAYWFAQFATDNLGRLTPGGAYSQLGGLPAGSGPRYLTAGPGNTIWVGLETAQKVARVSGVDPPPPPPPPPPNGPPDTELTKTPKNKVKAGRKGGKARFAFRSKPAGADFECALRRKGKRNKREAKLARYRACKSPKKYKRLRPGRYTFLVRATSAAGTDPSPAKDRFKVKRRR